MSKKVLMVLYYYHPYISGLTKVAYNLANGLAAKGYEVTVLTSQHDSGLPEEEIISGVRVIRKKVLFQLGKGVIAPGLLVDTIKLATKNDHVVFHMPIAEPALAALLIPSHKIISVYQCDLNLGDGIVKKTIEKLSYFFMNCLLARSKAIVVITKDYFASSKFSCYLPKAVEIYPPVDVSRYRDAGPAGNKLKNEKFSLGFVGRIVSEKGLEYLFQAIPYLKQSIESFEIIVAGDYQAVAGGSIYAQLQEYVKQYPSHITFTGKLSDQELVEFYRKIDVLVLPSVDPLEAFGIVQIEAMLSGTPVVASDLPGVRDPVKKSGFGHLARPKDPKDLAQKIALIYREGATLNNPGYLEEFTEDKVIGNFQKLLGS